MKESSEEAEWRDSGRCGSTMVEGTKGSSEMTILMGRGECSCVTMRSKMECGTRARTFHSFDYLLY